MQKFLLKVLVWVIIILIWTLRWVKQVWKYDIKIKYWVIPDFFNSPTQTETQNKNITIVSTWTKHTETKEEKINTNEIISKVIVNTFSENQTHWVSDSFDYNNNVYSALCDKYEDICNLTYFNWDFTAKQKIEYQAIIIFIIDKLDNILTTEKNITNVLYSLRLNKSQDWRRWYAWHRTVTINMKTIKSKKELFEVITHELWHIIDLWIRTWYSSIKNEIYTEFWEVSFSLDDPSIAFYELDWKNENTRKKWSSFKNFVSWYWVSDPFEDFAECVNMYLNHYAVFKYMASTNYILSQKFETMKTIFWNKYIFLDNKNLTKIKKDPYRRPWDTTKMN